MKYYVQTSWSKYRPERLSIGFIIAIACCLMAFNHTSYRNDEVTLEDIGYTTEEDIITPPITVYQEKKVLPPPNPKIDLIDNIIEVDQEDFLEEDFLMDEPLDENTEGKTLVDEYASAPVAESAPVVAPVVDTQENVYNTPLVFADHMPVFHSCDLDMDESERRTCTNNSMLVYVQSNVKYPPVARQNGIEGMVVASFVVEKDGSISDVEIVRDIGGGCGNEVIKVINSLENFYPAKQNGRPVRVIYRIPIKFKLQD